jgi:glycosyltransferase involved in cell wall biosynthesis
MPVISVIIPAFNAQETILEAILSVQNQTFSDLEIIVVNDGSNDHTLDILQKILEPRLKIFSCVNSGVSAARNYGISQATSDFIAFLDADDLWTSDKLELQLEALRINPKAGLAYSWVLYKFESERDSYIDASNSFEGKVYADLLIKNFVQSGSNPLIHKKIIDSIGCFDPELKTCEDWDFYLRVAAKWDFALVRKAQIIYRQSSTSLTSKINLMEKYSLIVIDRAFSKAPLEFQYLKRQSLAWAYQFTAQQCLKYYHHDFRAISLAIDRLLKVVLLNPKILFEEHTQGLFKKLLKTLFLLFYFRLSK